MNSTVTTNQLDRSRVTGRRVLRRSTTVTIVGAALISLGAGSDSQAEAAVTTAPGARTIASATTTVPPVTPTTSVTSDGSGARPSATVDELVGIDGRRLHVRCVGSGATTVLLIAGFESADGSWEEIEPAISQENRVCSYARFGTGTSDPPVSTQTFTTQATDLHALLTAAGEPSPYVVVGHSFGGAEALRHSVVPGPPSVASTGARWGLLGDRFDALEGRPDRFGVAAGAITRSGDPRRGHL